MPAANWSLGAARWMEDSTGRVIAIKRTRVTVEFAEHDRSVDLLGQALRVVESS